MIKQLMDLQVKTLEENNEYYEFEGIISATSLDRGNDVIILDAYNTTLNAIAKGHQVVVLWQHNNNEPLGKATELRKTENGLMAKFLLPKNDHFIQTRVMPQVKVGSITGLSIGFKLLKSYYNQEEDVRYISDMLIFEFSLVTIPMNADAVITSIKSLDDATQLFKNKEEATKLLMNGVSFSKETAEHISNVMYNYIEEKQKKLDNINLKKDELNCFLKLFELTHLN